jgi:hypothetical protein
MPAVKDRLSNSDFLKLRSWRGRKDFDLSIGRQVDAIAKSAAAQHRKMDGLDGAWDELVPAPIRKLCAVVGIAGGVLTIKVPSAAARFQLDRWLRSGGEAALSRRGGIKRIKLT